MWLLLLGNDCIASIDIVPSPRSPHECLCDPCKIVLETTEPSVKDEVYLGSIAPLFSYSDFWPCVSPMDLDKETHISENWFWRTYTLHLCMYLNHCSYTLNWLWGALHQQNEKLFFFCLFYHKNSRQGYNDWKCWL